MVKTDKIRARPNPPKNASDIKIPIGAIDLLCEAGDLTSDQRALLEKNLPAYLLPYFLARAPKSSEPTTKQRNDSLRALKKKAERLQKEIENTPWLKGALIWFETQDLFNSNEVLRGMALRGQAEHEHRYRCELRASQLVENDLEAVNRLQKGIASLEFDDIGRLETEQRSPQQNAERPQISYLCQHLHLVWSKVLRERIVIGPKSDYVAFAKCLFEWVGEPRSDGTVIDRLTTAKKEMAELEGQ